VGGRGGGVGRRGGYVCQIRCTVTLEYYLMCVCMMCVSQMYAFTCARDRECESICVCVCVKKISHTAHCAQRARRSKRESA